MTLQSSALLSAFHVGFDDLSAAGYDVQIIDDGAIVTEFENSVLDDLPGNWNWKRKHPQSVIVPKVAILPNAMLFKDGSALLPDGSYCFFDVAFCSERDGWAERHGQRILCSIDRETEGAYVRSNMPNIYVTGRCFSTRTYTFRNFGHFIHDVLSRIYYEDLGAIVPGRDKVIAPQMLIPMQEALFRKAFYGYEIVRVPPDAILRVEELLISTNLCSEQRFNPAAIAALAKKIRVRMGNYAGKERHKICVSRRDGRIERDLGRDFTNMEAYENRMRALGYQVVELSTLDPETQFALWANTTDIVGIHGAGMMNMIMMPSGGNYTEIAGACQSDHTYSPTSPCPNWIIRCAWAAGHRVRGILGQRSPQAHPAIDIERLEAALTCGE